MGPKSWSDHVLYYKFLISRFMTNIEGLNRWRRHFQKTVCFDRRRYLANMNDPMWNVNAWHATIYLNPNQTKITDMYHSGLWYLVDEGPMMAPQRSPSPGTPSSLSSSSDSETSGGTYLKNTTLGHFSIKKWWIKRDQIMQNQMVEGRQKMAWNIMVQSIHDYQWQNRFCLKQLFGSFVIWFYQEVFETEYMWNCWMLISTTIVDLIQFAKLAKKYLVCRAVHVSMMELNVL